MTVKITIASNGAHRRHLMREIFVPNLKNQKTDFMDINLLNQRVCMNKGGAGGF
ncbi:MAG: hypothetical protein MI742_09870 [Desulfobacterales bacterium]|nr:hypothetical protein [Desulfobacterales bacterium]